MYAYCALLFSFVPSHASTLNETQPTEEIKNVNIERADVTLKSMKPIQFLNNNCFCVCAIYIMHTAFMYVSMIWKEQVYNVKYDTAESLSNKHQALLMFYLFLWYFLCSMIYFAKYRATGPGIQIQCDHCRFEACVCSISNPGFPEPETRFYNGKVLVVRLNNAVFSYIRSSYVSSIIDVARTVFTKAKFA